MFCNPCYRVYLLSNDLNWFTDHFESHFHEHFLQYSTITIKSQLIVFYYKQYLWKLLVVIPENCFILVRPDLFEPSDFHFWRSWPHIGQFISMPKYLSSTLLVQWKQLNVIIRLMWSIFLRISQIPFSFFQSVKQRVSFVNYVRLILILTSDMYKNRT